jgi:hypothetical protein
MTTLQSFVLFPKLPLEVRDLIWEAALPPPRNVYVREEEFETEKEWSVLEEMQYEEDLCGKNEEDTRSLAEKDMCLLLHKTYQGLDVRLKRQTQLQKYGFTSGKPAPGIRHVCFYDTVSLPGYGWYEPGPIPASRDVRLLLHLCDSLWPYPSLRQKQLHSYGFTSTRPRPEIRHLRTAEFAEAVNATRLWSNSSIPVVLHVCRESRQLAIRCGYALAFSNQWAPAHTWFNFRTDYLHLDGRYPYLYEHLEKRYPYEDPDKTRIRRAVIWWQRDLPEEVFKIVNVFQNLEELAIRTGIYPQDEPLASNLHFVDCTNAEAFLEGPWASNPAYTWAIKGYIKAHPEGSSYHEAQIRDIEHFLTTKLESVRQPGHPEIKVPKFRHVFETHAECESKLQACRARFWAEEEEDPPKEPHERIRKEELEEEIIRQLQMNDPYY